MVLAVGGGSVIDAAKVIAGAAKYDGDAWDLVLDRTKIKAALPVYSVSRLPQATGSEMDPFAVISDLSKNEKWELLAPVRAEDVGASTLRIRSRSRRSRRPLALPI